MVSYFNCVDENNNSINNLNCLIIDILNRKKYNSDYLFDKQTKLFEVLMSFFDDKRNKFIEEGIDKIKLQMNLEGINQFENKELHNTKMKEGKNLLSVKLMNQEINMIYVL